MYQIFPYFGLWGVPALQIWWHTTFSNVHYFGGTLPSPGWLTRRRDATNVNCSVRALTKTVDVSIRFVLVYLVVVTKTI